MNIQRFLEMLRQGAVDPVHAARYHGGGKGSTPDYSGAAQQQAQAMQAAAANPEAAGMAAGMMQ